MFRFCRSLIGGISKSPEMNRIPGVYILAMKELSDQGSPGWQNCYAFSCFDLLLIFAFFSFTKFLFINIFTILFSQNFFIKIIFLLFKMHGSNDRTSFYVAKNRSLFFS